MKYLGIFLLLFMGCSHWDEDVVLKEKCDQRIVIKVGGCSKYGYCKVRLNDNSTDLMVMPVEGEKFCKTEYVWEKRK